MVGAIPLVVFGGLIGPDWTHSDGPCQRTLTDWVLTYTKEYIEAIPKVTLCGYIKKDVREKWQSILGDERNGTHHDMTAAKKVIEKWDIQDLWVVVMSRASYLC